MKKMIYILILSALWLNIPIGFASPVNTTGCITVGTITTCPNPSPTVSAINDAATITVDSSTQPTVIVNLIANDVGAGAAIVNNPNGLYGSLSNMGLGVYTYILNMGNASVRALSQGQTLTDTFSYQATSSADPRITATAQLTITINGPSIIPTAYPVSVSVQIDLTKSSASAAVNVLAGNINAGSTSLTGSTAGKYGYLDLGTNPSLGQYTYNVNLNNKDVIALTNGQTLVETFSYSIRPPGNGTTTAQSTITITLIGATATPVANPIIASVQINPTQTTASASIDVLSNANNATNASVSNSVGQYGYLDLGASPSAGKYTYNVNMNSPAVQALTSGQQLTDTFSYTVKGLGNSTATAQSTITINILGSTTTPIIVTAVPDIATVSVSSATPSPTVTLRVMSNDINGNLATLTSSSVGKYGALVGGITGDGTLIYQVNSSNAAVQQLLSNANAPALQDTFTYSISAASPNQRLTSQTTVTINIVASNVTPFKAADYALPITATSTGTATTPTTVTGNLQTYNANLLNISNPNFAAAILSSLVGKYGQISFNSSTKDFTYTLNPGVSQLQALMNGGTLQDTFSYSITNSYGVTAQANIIINITSNHQQPVINNTEVESNDLLNLATPLQAGIFMNGNLSQSNDRDFYLITSSGNETFTFQLCPTGTACNGGNAWVMYVFDGSILTQDMLNTTETLNLTRDDTGGVLGSIQVSHMYSLYNYGVFDKALLAVIDPCYGASTTVNVGVPLIEPGTKRSYYVAISSPLQRTTAATATAPCGGGSILLTKPGASISVQSATGTAQTVTTTQQYYAVLPNSDDQYSLLMSRTAIDPVASTPSVDQAIYNSATGAVAIPKVRVNNQLYSVQLQQTAPTALSQTNFSIAAMQALNTPLTANPYQGLYNPANNLIDLPRVTLPLTSKSYSVKLQYMPNDGSLQYISSVPLD